MKDKTTKKQQVLDHFKAYGELDSWTAIQKYGATRLADIVWRLKREGHQIEPEEKSGKDRNNNTCNFCNYKYISDPQGNAFQRRVDEVVKEPMIRMEHSMVFDVRDSKPSPPNTKLVPRPIKYKQKKEVTTLVDPKKLFGE
jgi:hypothetical protein